MSIIGSWLKQIIEALRSRESGSPTYHIRTTEQEQRTKERLRQAAALRHQQEHVHNFQKNMQNQQQQQQKRMNDFHIQQRRRQQQEQLNNFHKHVQQHQNMHKPFRGPGHR